MRVMFSPQIRDIFTPIEYTFKGEIITVKMGEIIDTFDFSSFPDGDVDVQSIETILPDQPIKGAIRKDGILSVWLLNIIPEEASQEELFPQWMEVS